MFERSPVIRFTGYPDGLSGGHSDRLDGEECKSEREEALWDPQRRLNEGVRHGFHGDGPQQHGQGTPRQNDANRGRQKEGDEIEDAPSPLGQSRDQKIHVDMAVLPENESSGTAEAAPIM